MITIKDVARRANVSPATVSRVINNNGYVSEQTRKRVNEAIQALNFRPSAVARTLYSKTSKMISLVLPNITNPFFPELAKAVESTAFKNGYTVILCDTDGNVDKEKKYFEVLEQKYIDGMILTTNQGKLPIYESSEIPIVALDRFVNKNIPTVIADNKKGAEIATRHLLDCGCSYIAHIRGPEGLLTADERLTGFLQVVKKEKANFVVELSEFDIENAEIITYKLLKDNPQIDGIFASSDVVAAGAIKAVNKLNLNIPRDIQVIGFDGIPFGKFLTPSLTTIGQPIKEMGALAVELLIKQIERKTFDKKYYRLQTKFISGETTICD